MPASRSRYLAEIAECIRGYHAQTEELAQHASRAQALGVAQEVLGDAPELSEPPTELAANVERVGGRLDRLWAYVAACPRSEFDELALYRAIAKSGEVWARRQLLKLSDDLSVAVPTLDDLISTKRFGARPKDAEHVRLLEAERERRGRT